MKHFLLTCIFFFSFFLHFSAYAFFCTNLCITCLDITKQIKPTEKSTNKKKISCISYVPLLPIAFVSYHLNKICVHICLLSNKTYLFLYIFSHLLFSSFFFDKIFHPASQQFQVLLQSRFQTPNLSIPVQQEAQEACCVDAGCGKENHFIKEATGKQMSIYPL